MRALRGTSAGAVLEVEQPADRGHRTGGHRALRRLRLALRAHPRRAASGMWSTSTPRCTRPAARASTAATLKTSAARPTEGKGPRPDQRPFPMQTRFLTLDRLEPRRRVGLAPAGRSQHRRQSVLRARLRPPGRAPPGLALERAARARGGRGVARLPAGHAAARRSSRFRCSPVGIRPTRSSARRWWPRAAKRASSRAARERPARQPDRRGGARPDIDRQRWHGRRSKTRSLGGDVVAVARREFDRAAFAPDAAGAPLPLSARRRADLRRTRRRLEERLGAEVEFVQARARRPGARRVPRSWRPPVGRARRAPRSPPRPRTPRSSRSCASASRGSAGSS